MIAETKAPATCARAEGTICMCKHTGHGKKDLTPKNGASHPPTPHQLRYPECIHVCSREGAGGLEKGGNVPGRSRLNTFVSPTRRHKHYRQAAARSCCKKLPQTVKNSKTVKQLRWFFSSSSSRKKNKDGRCISTMNSLLIQSPEPVLVDLRAYDGLINALGYTGGNVHRPNA